MPVNLQDLISQKEAAEIRGVSIQAIDYLIRAGRLKGVKVGGKTFVLRKDVETFKPVRTGRPRTKKRAKSPAKNAKKLTSKK